MLKLSTFVTACLLGASAALVAQAAPKPAPTNLPPGFTKAGVTCEDFQEAPIEYTVIRNSAKDLLGFSTKDDTKLITRNDDGTSISKEVPLIITRCHSEFMGYTGSKAIGWLKTRDGRCVTVNLDSGEINVTGCSTADDKTQLSQFWQAAPDGSLAFLGYKAGDPEVIWRFNVHQDDAEGPIYATTQEGTITLAFKTTA